MALPARTSIVPQPAHHSGNRVVRHKSHSQSKQDNFQVLLLTPVAYADLAIDAVARFPGAGHRTRVSSLLASRPPNPALPAAPVVPITSHAMAELRGRLLVNAGAQLQRLVLE